MKNFNFAKIIPAAVSERWVGQGKSGRTWTGEEAVAASR